MRAPDGHEADPTCRYLPSSRLWIGRESSRFGPGAATHRHGNERPRRPPTRRSFDAWTTTGDAGAYGLDVTSSGYVIEYDATFVFPVSAAQLWARMLRFDRFASWWAWLREFSVEGDGFERGTVLHGVVAPPLPYRMRLDVVLDECVAPRSITAHVHGDLEGTAMISLDGDGAETRAHATWQIEMMQRPMRLAARVALPLLRWGHDRVVEATVAGFRSHLVDAD